MWKIHFDYSVLNTTNNYEAIGSGTDYALGSLFTTEDNELTPIKRVHKALQSASKFSVGVNPPFYIFNTESDDVVKFDK